MKYCIVGIGEYSSMMCRYFKNTEGKPVDAYTVPGEFIKEKELNGIPVIAAEELNSRFSPEQCRLIMGIGYRDMNQIKQKEFGRYKSLGYDFINYIHPTAIIEKDVVIGEGNNIFEGVIIQSGVSIGDANLIYGGALVAHDTTIGSFNSLSVKACVAGCTTVGNNCFLGANSTVRDHLNIADFTLVGAGVYAGKETEEFDVVVGARSTILEGRKSTEFI